MFNISTFGFNQKLIPSNGCLSTGGCSSCFLAIVTFLVFYPLSCFSGLSFTTDKTLSVLTCGTAKPLYAAFGHTALRFRDSANGIDQVYNFGTFNPNTPNFYLKFLGGKLDYFLSVTDYEDFLKEYVSENRTIWEQELHFSPKEIKAVFDSLQILYQPENRNYRYDFFRNNCTTKVRDLIFSQIADTVILNPSEKQAGDTWRHTLKSSLENRSWLLTGINVLLGPFADRKITRYEKMFLPANFMEELELSGIAAKPIVLFRSTSYHSTEIPLFTPIIVFWIILGLFILEAFWLNTYSTFSIKLNQVLFGITAFLGIIFLFLWIWSDHIALRYNLNIVWANPLNLLTVWLLTRVNSTFTKIYLFLYSLLLFFVIINFTRLPQKFPIEIMPVVVLLAFSSINQVFQFRKKKNVNS